MIVFTIGDIFVVAILAVIGFLLLAMLVKEWVCDFLDWMKGLFGGRGRKEMVK